MANLHQPVLGFDVSPGGRHFPAQKKIWRRNSRTFSALRGSANGQRRCHRRFSQCGTGFLQHCSHHVACYDGNRFAPTRSPSHRNIGWVKPRLMILLCLRALRSVWVARISRSWSNPTSPICCRNSPGTWTSPTADPAIITAYLVCREARKQATVLLSGVGGDELFAGYRKHSAHCWAQAYQRVPVRCAPRCWKMLSLTCLAFAGRR